MDGALCYFTMSNLCIIPARAVRDRSLTDTDIRLLCAIGTHTDRWGANCFAGAKTLAEEAGIGRSTFFVAAGRLVDLGYVKKTRRFRKNGSDTSSAYHIVLDQPLPESSQVDSTTSEKSSPLDPPRPDRLDPHNDVALTPSSSAVAPDFAPDYAELLMRVSTAGGSTAAWSAEILATGDGMHGKSRTPVEIGQAIRDFNASGADISLRLFRGYLRGNGPANGKKASIAEQGYANAMKGIADL